MANWDVFREMDHLRREIDEAFRGAGLGRAFPAGFLAATGGRRFPLVNLSEDENAVYVDALVPGIDPGELEMSVLRNTLTIAGERKPPVEERGQILHRSERGFGSFSRTLELPAEIDPAKVTAACRDGVLTVTLGKAEAAKPKKVAVQVG